MNQVQIFGRLTRDPELRHTPAGKAVVNFSLAVNRYGNNNEADFFDCIAWEKQAEGIANSCKKGHRLLVWGRLQQEHWTDQQTQQQRSAIKIVVSGFSFIEPPPQQGQQPGGSPGYQGQQGYQQPPNYGPPGHGQPPGYVPPTGPGPHGYPQGAPGQQPGGYPGQPGQMQGGYQQGGYQGQPGQAPTGYQQNPPGPPPGSGSPPYQQNPGGPPPGQGAYPNQGQQQGGYSGAFNDLPF